MLRISYLEGYFDLIIPLKSTMFHAQVLFYLANPAFAITGSKPIFGLLPFKLSDKISLQFQPAGLFMDHSRC